jgi:hypothetical protein
MAMTAAARSGNHIEFPALEPAMADLMIYDAGARAPLTADQRKVRAAERRADAEQAMREHVLAHKAFHDNRERLKAARLSREAAGKKS